MNEIQLSNDLNVITAEINSYKQVAGQAIFEIGRRLKHVKENDLAHGQWIKWLETINMDRTEAFRYMQVVDELGSDVGTYQHLGLRALSEIATLPPEEREKEHTLKSGETKTVDEMTVRELREVKAKLKEAEEAKVQAEKQVEALKKSEQAKIERIEELEEREPKVVEKEVVPDDYKSLKGNYESLKRVNKIYEEQNQQLREELERLDKERQELSRKSIDDSRLECLRERERQLNEKINQSYKLHELQSEMEKFISVISPAKHTINFGRISNEHDLLESFEMTLDGIIKICQEYKGMLPNKNIIEGEILNG